MKEEPTFAKNTVQSMTSEEEKALERERILSGFLAAVKICQARYGGRTELATENDPRISTLCHCLEDTLVHGLRIRMPSLGLTALRQVKDLVSSSFNINLTLGHNEHENPVLWWYVRELLTKHEYERFLLLRNIKTDEGRGRAWLRSLLNEHSLERYMHIMVSDSLFLEQWYEPWALLRDQERAAMLPNLASGLDSILFAINIDNESFNGGAKITGGSKELPEKINYVEPEPELAKLPLSETGGKMSPSKKGDKKRKKKVPSLLVSFDDDDSSPSSLNPKEGYFSPLDASPIQPDDPKKGHDDTNLVHQSYKRILEGEIICQRSSFDNHSPSSTSDFGQDSKCSLKDQDQDDDSCKSEYSGDTFSQNYSRRPHLTTLQGDPTNLIPLSPDGEAVYNITGADDAVSCKSSSQDEDLEALEPSGDLDEGKKLDSSRRRTPKGSTLNPYCFSSLTYDELHSAVLEISRTRDALEESRNEARLALEKEMDVSSGLRAQLTHERAQNGEMINRITSKVNTLMRENELLRHQLKKYIGAVQMLRREGLEEGAAITSDEVLKPLQRPPPDLRDYHNEAMAYESKLIQVAEMHGELMEFNERLQRLLKFRESQVRHLRSELVELRGPLPLEDAEESVEDSLSIASDLDTLVSQPRTLINIWIPTAFLAGPSSDTHHVYQIYVRIRDHEWNVYRRFTQFYEFHKLLKKKYPLVKTLDFPQKKTFGYKEIAVVENRRLRLQQYLRKLVNLIVSAHPHLSTEPDKASLTAVLPFLLDFPPDPSDQSQLPRTGGRNSKGLLSRLSTSGTQTSCQSSTPQYSGL